MRGRLIVAIGVAACAASTANAQTYCVSAPPGCLGDVQPSVRSAMLAALLTPERDLVRVGPGDFVEPAGGWPGNGQQIDIEGSGATQTILRRSLSTDLFQVPTGGTLSDIGFFASDGSGSFVTTSGALTRVRITSAPTFNGAGVSMSGNGSVSASTIVLPTAGGTSGIAVQAGAGTKAISDVDLQAGVGIGLQGSATIQRARITAGRFGISTRTAAVVDDALIRMVNEPGVVTPAGIEADTNAGNGVDAEVTARHVTIIGSGRADEAGVHVQGLAPGLAAAATITNSVIRGTAISVRTTSTVTAAVVSASFTALDPATGVAEGAFSTPPDIFSPSNTNADPGFVNPAAGDFRLSATSPLLESGSFTAIAAGESSTDLDGNPRVLNATGACGVAGRRDMGAFEFTPAVKAFAQVSAAKLAVGAPAMFTSTGSCDPGSLQVPTMVWTFDDGANASGASATHAFTSPGTHVATLTVQRAGSTVANAATVNVVVQDVTAPKMTITPASLRLTPAGRARIGLRCPATELSGPCTGTLTLRTAAPVAVQVGGRTVRRVITIGSLRFSVRAGRLKTVLVHISAAGRAIISARSSLPVRASAAAKDAAGNRRTVVRSITLKS